MASIVVSQWSETKAACTSDPDLMHHLATTLSDTYQTLLTCYCGNLILIGLAKLNVNVLMPIDYKLPMHFCIWQFKMVNI